MLAVRVSACEYASPGGLSVELLPKASLAKLPVNAPCVRRTAVDFATLRAELGKEYAGAVVPPLPPVTRGSYVVTDEDLSDDTAQALELFVKRCLAHRELATSYALKAFCLADEPVWAHVRKDLTYHAGGSAKVSRPVSTQLAATTEAAAHALGAYGGKGARAPPAHVVETPDDAAIVAHKQWAAELEAHVLDVQARARALQASANKAAVERAFFASNALEMASSQDESNRMGLGRLRETAETAKAQANRAAPALVRALGDIGGFLGALREACDAREDARLALQAARLQLQSVQSSHKGGAGSRAAAAKRAAPPKPPSSPAAPPTPTKLTKDQSDSAREVFDMFDADGSGTISMRELGYAFQAMGKKVTPDELDKMMKIVDKDHSGEIEYDEFLSLVAPLIAGEAKSLDEVLARTMADADAAGASAHQSATELAQAAVSGLQALALSASASDEDLAKMEALVSDLDDEFHIVSERCLREAVAFEESIVPRLKATLVAYFKVELFYCQQQKGILTNLVKELGGRERQIAGIA